MSSQAESETSHLKIDYRLIAAIAIPSVMPDGTACVKAIDPHGNGFAITFPPHIWNWIKRIKMD